MSKKRKAKALSEAIEPITIANDTATPSGVSEAATPEIDKGYSTELKKALSHILPASEKTLDFTDDWITDEERDNVICLDGEKHTDGRNWRVMLDNLVRNTTKKIVLNYGEQSNDMLIIEMATRQFKLNTDDSRYLRIAIRNTHDYKMRDSLLVFNRRK